MLLHWSIMNKSIIWNWKLCDKFCEGSLQMSDYPHLKVMNYENLVL
jgi:hypothetical protein